MSDLPPAGWYPDPTGGPAGLRYWDGARWTDHVHDARTRPLHDAPEGWTQGPDGSWKPPVDGTTGTLRTGVTTSDWDPALASRPPAVIPDPVPQSGRAWTTYWTDLKWSTRALVASPWLIVLSLVPSLLIQYRVRDVRPVALWTLLTVAVEIFYIGFLGMQRVWFLRRARGVRVHPLAVWNLSWRFFGRFLVLDLLLAVPVAIVVTPILIANTHRVVSASGSVTTTTTHPWVQTVTILAVVFVGDVVLTFVVPALALTSRSVRAAFRLGWEVTKGSWPTNAWYLLAPGITLFALAGALPRSVLPTGVAIPLALVSALLALWFKGANVAFYIRAVPPVGVDGAH